MTLLLVTMLNITRVKRPICLLPCVAGTLTADLGFDGSLVKLFSEMLVFIKNE
jgi:hypothetical protein